jgi:hypothetical protein
MFVPDSEITIPVSKQVQKLFQFQKLAVPVSRQV